MLKQFLFVVLVILTSLQVGAQSVDKNGKRISAITTAAQDALNAKANIASPTFTRTFTIPTLVAGTNTFPSTNGTTNQVLTTDGSGTASWVSLNQNYSVTMVTSSQAISNTPSDLYAVHTTNNSIILTLPLISSLPNGGKATFTN
jgi:hypothetical protein